MSRFTKMLYLTTIYEDFESKMMIFFEWFRSDPILNLRFEVACRIGDFYEE